MSVNLSITKYNQQERIAVIERKTVASTKHWEDNGLIITREQKCIELKNRTVAARAEETSSLKPELSES